MSTRHVVYIDEEKCVGCGKCVPNCGHGVLKVVDSKALIVDDAYCDGLGACLGVCPLGAISIIECKAEEPAATPCPGAAVLSFAGDGEVGASHEGETPPSALTQWPVQLSLVPVHAAFFDGADVLLSADCVPFALADFHGLLLRGRKLLVGCPKLGDVAAYADKLTAILRQNNIRSMTVAHMEVPCCRGLLALAERAAAASGKPIALEEVVVGGRGGVQSAVRAR